MDVKIAFSTEEEFVKSNRKKETQQKTFISALSQLCLLLFSQRSTVFVEWSKSLQYLSCKRIKSIHNIHICILCRNEARCATHPLQYMIAQPNWLYICQNTNTKATAGHSANIFVHAFIFVSCAAIKLRVNLTLFFVDGKRFPVWPDWLQLPSLLLAHAQLHSILKYLKSNTEWPDQFWHPSRSHAQPPHSITSKPQYEVFTN